MRAKCRCYFRDDKPVGQAEWRIIDVRLIPLAVAALMAAIGTMPRPASGATYSWALNAGGGLTGSGQLITGGVDNGGFDITKFSGAIGGVPVDLLGGDPGAPTISGMGAFIYDNVLYSSSNPLLSTWGVLFSIAGKEGNIWGNDTPGSYSYYTYSGSTYDYANGSASFTLIPVASAEPSALAVFAIGLLGCRLTRRRTKAASAGTLHAGYPAA